MRNLVPLLLAALAIFGLCSCETTGSSSTGKGETAIRNFNFQGLRIGDRVGSLSHFAQVQRVPFGRTDYEVYQIYNPNDQISLAVAYFSGGVLKRLELRYFDGPGIDTLSRAGGWAGLRDYLIARFGPPSITGSTVPLVTDFPDLKPAFAKYNAAWLFTRQNRQINYIASADPKGGVAIITFCDTTPPPTPRPTPMARPTPLPRTIPSIRPNPPAPQTAPVGTVTRQAPPNPGF